MVQSETVTILNDACVMAPGALIDPAFVWAPIDDRTAQVTFTRLAVTVSATLHFDDADQLIDFQAVTTHDNDLPTDLVATWTSDLDGELSIDETPDSLAELLGSGLLSGSALPPPCSSCG